MHSPILGNAINLAELFEGGTAALFTSRGAVPRSPTEADRNRRGRRERIPESATVEVAVIPTARKLLTALIAGALGLSSTTVSRVFGFDAKSISCRERHFLPECRKLVDEARRLGRAFRIREDHKGPSVRVEHFETECMNWEALLGALGKIVDDPAGKPIDVGRILGECDKALELYLRG